VITLSDVTVLRDGPVRVVRGRLDDRAVIARLSAPTLPWLDPGSSFYGGAGLVPPWTSLVFHEAAALRRLDPDGWLKAGVTEGVSWLVRSDVLGVPLTPGALGARPLLVGLLREAARLHAHDVLHRDLRPANVLVDGNGVRVIDFDVARVEGIGPVGVLGSSAWRAPEMLRGEGDARADLYAIGRLVRWAAPEGADSTTDAMVSALVDAWPGGRPASAAEALAALGVPGAPTPRLSPPHRAVLAWWATRWVELTLGSPGETVRLADEHLQGRWELAAVAGRLLAAAPARGRDTWLSLGALCWRLAELAAPEERVLYADQAREALGRSGLSSAENAWHPPARGLARLLEGAAGVDEPRARCDAGLASSAFERARSERAPSRAALAALHLGRMSQVEVSLKRKHAADPLATEVAATRLLMLDPVGIDAAWIPLADGERVVRVVGQLVRAGRTDAARRLAAHAPEAHAARAQLTCALALDEETVAHELARGLAETGRWDEVVAATVVTDTHAPTLLRMRAAGVLRAGDPPERSGAPLAIAALGDEGADPGTWALGITALVRAGRHAEAASTLGLAENAPPVAWRVLVADLLARGEVPSALVIAEAGRMRWPTDVPLLLVAACVYVASGNDAGAADLLDKVLTEEPDDPLRWLADALRLAAAGREHEAERRVRTAAALGADEALLRIVRGALRVE
jgi:hypothetical protein